MEYRKLKNRGQQQTIHTDDNNIDIKADIQPLIKSKYDYSYINGTRIHPLIKSKYD